MTELIIFNLILIAIITAVLIVCKKFVKRQKAIDLLLLISAVITILCHYSSLPYHHFSDGTAMTYLKHNPNLILPIYPCNVVMWSCLIYGLLRNKSSAFGVLLADYIFWFGIVSTLVGMFANVDFVRNPDLGNYDISKGVLAHATMLFNVLLFPLFGKTKINFSKNMINIFISVVAMYLIGLYCNLIFETLVSEEMAYSVNSMFIIHSPFEAIPFLTYPSIAGIALVLYFILFTVCEIIARKKGERYFDRIISKLKKSPDLTQDE